MKAAPDSPPSRVQSGLLLVALIFVIVFEFGNPLTGYWGRFLAGILHLALFSMAGFLIGARRRWLVAYVAITIPLIVVGVASSTVADPPDSWLITRHLLSLGIQVLLVCLVFRFSLFQWKASRLDRVIAGICGYLILGLTWADLYSLHEILRPGGLIHSSGGSVDDSGGSRLYFSLVTLTTTGYGDILPASPATRLLTTLEALTGTLYLAVFISSLISGGEKRPMS